ncbi:splicing factor 3B subunit 5/RDS3 complex subunit 10 [Wallemia mellicola CBS 633.66]|uniref:Splicing factor subunit n=1 Tax=Wallemia mellicola (strain ATCC MYA-4683 / CBS 633.66) TaxID=671144 RepID=I4Y9Q2_WALMC|nr:splicing factor 3B subunit 5/RDS3 complex subunit 10 [Wallemia mellicola CBS 633.66]EIM20694.1 splicing factor 3B subunit 5/RDS3 complex subunit 10 [Wallemia mellicola CBS 633.66]|eukprot:XP_006959227.1 splicing factor 3B subunit 5/RDS3 complex subunit 10 [Wallemia mellicola CBS 633.66]
MVNNLNYIQNQQLERLHARYTGTGHPDISKHEWVTNQQRDTLSSIVGHPTLSSYMSIADGQSISRTKFNMIEAMISPAGPPPEKED